MNLLAIDDNNDNLLTLRAILSVFLPEASLSSVLSGREGIQRALATNPDIILLDIQMPGMDGFEVARILKGDPATRHIPIIMLTALHTDSGSKVKGLESGADAFLAKPIDEAELVAQVKAMLRIRRSEDALRRERDSLEDQVAIRMRELHEKQRMNKLLLDALPHHAYLINHERTILATNRIAAEDGARIGDFCWCGVHKLSAITPEEKQFFLETGESTPGTCCHFCRLDEAMAAQKTVKSEEIREGRHMEVWWVPVDHNVHLHFFMDVTERHDAEKERRKLEEQLHHAQRLESIGNLAGGIAHDFNNVLTIISGYAELLRLACKNDQATSMVKEIIASVERAAGMTASLLAFSRKQHVQLQHDNLLHIVTNLKKTLSHLIREDICLNIETGSDNLPVMADRTQIDQILFNLVINARDAMPAGGDLTIRTSSLTIDESSLLLHGIDRPGKYACVTIADSGTGMDRATVEHIFEPFFTTKGVGQGTGLGLSIVYGIVKKHDGFISVDSMPGEGTTFSVFLPLRRYQPDTELPAEPTGAPPACAGTILVAEDDPSVRKLVTLMLGGRGYTVLAAEDGDLGLELFRTNRDRIDLIISDVIMPRKKGTDMCIEIRELAPRIPIILMSGYTDGSARTESFNGYGFEFIQKPLKPDHLFATVSRLLKPVQSNLN